MQTPTRSTTGNFLALDVGERRIGVALASSTARLPRPLTTLEHTQDVVARIQALVASNDVSVVVLGLPRGLEGQHTAQTVYVETFAKELQKEVQVPLEWQDEAVTSRQAEAELVSRGKPFAKGDIDALSATYILQDFLDRPVETEDQA